MTNVNNVVNTEFEAQAARVALFLASKGVKGDPNFIRELIHAVTGPTDSQDAVVPKGIQAVRVDENVTARLRDYFSDEGNWGEHPKYPRSDWEYETSEGNTGRSYWEFVEAELDANQERFPWDSELDLAKEILELFKAEVLFCSKDDDNAKHTKWAVYFPDSCVPHTDGLETEEQAIIHVFNKLLEAVSRNKKIPVHVQKAYQVDDLHALIIEHQKEIYARQF